VLVTGAAGFVGSHLARGCIEHGWHVTAVDSFTPYYERMKRANAEAIALHDACRFVEGDLVDLNLLALLSEIDVVFHLAAQPGVRASWGESFDTYTHANVTAFQRLLEAAKQAPVDRFVFASSSSVYGDAERLPTPEDTLLRPVSPYGATKAAGEYLAYLYFKSYRVPTVGLRYFTVYGPGQRPDMAFHRLILSALTGAEFELFGDGEQTRDFTFVGDAVAATIAASDRGQAGSIYNLGGGSRVSMNDVIATLGRLMGAEVPVTRIERQRGDARDTAADTSRARRDLGFSPSYSLDDGLTEQVEWQRANLDLLVGASAATT
jgi:nucleoside-diphosphate-sugar epimerase